MIGTPNARASIFKASEIQIARQPMQWDATALNRINRIVFNPPVCALGSGLMRLIQSFADRCSISTFCVGQKIWVPGFFGKRHTLAQRKDAAVLASRLGQVVHIDDVALICINGCSSHFLSSGCEEAIVA